MKKKILFAFSVLTYFALILINVNVYAEETTLSTSPVATEQTTEPTTNVEPIITTTLPNVEDLEDSISLEEQLNDFANKWGNGILSALMGVLGSSGIIILAKGVVKKMSTKISEGINLTEEERKTATEDLEKAKTTLAEHTLKYENHIAELKEMIPNMANEFNLLLKQYEEEIGALKDTVSTLTKDFTVAKELIAILISQTPELAKNGLATKILEVLSGKDVSANE